MSEQPDADAMPPETAAGLAEFRDRLDVFADDWRQFRSAHWPPPEPPVQLRIDPNARTPEGHVPVQYANPERPLKRGSHVIVYEPEDGVAATATVMRVYGDWLHLDVDWAEMVNVGEGTTPEAPLHPDVLAQLWHWISEWEGE